MRYEAIAIGSTTWTLLALTFLFVGAAALHETCALHLEITIAQRILTGVLYSCIVGVCAVGVFYGYDVICESSLPDAESIVNALKAISIV